MLTHRDDRNKYHGIKFMGEVGMAVIKAHQQSSMPADSYSKTALTASVVVLLYAVKLHA